MNGVVSCDNPGKLKTENWQFLGSAPYSSKTGNLHCLESSKQH